jgi:hypothetical protein
MRSNLSNSQKKSAYGCLSAADSKIRIFSEAFFLNGSERKWTVSQSQLDFWIPIRALYVLCNCPLGVQPIMARDTVEIRLKKTGTDLIVAK